MVSILKTIKALPDPSLASPVINTAGLEILLILWNSQFNYAGNLVLDMALR